MRTLQYYLFILGFSQLLPFTQIILMVVAIPWRHLHTIDFMAACVIPFYSVFKVIDYWII